MHIHVCHTANADRFEDHLISVVRPANQAAGRKGSCFAPNSLQQLINTDPFNGGHRCYLFALEGGALISAAQLDMFDACARLSLLDQFDGPIEACVDRGHYRFVLCAALEFLSTQSCVTMLEAPMLACCTSGQCSKRLTRSAIVHREWRPRSDKNAQRRYNPQGMVEIDVGHKALHDFKLVCAIHGDVLSDLA